MRTLALCTITAAAVAVAVLAGTVLAQPPTRWGPNDIPQQLAAHMTRACIPEAGHAQAKLSVSSSAGTGQLDANAVYRIWCSVDAYYELGDAANPTADANAIPIGASSVEYFATGDNASRYLSAVDQAGASGTCWVSRCL